MATKLKQAETLCSDKVNLQKGIQLLEQIALNRLQTDKTRFDALRKLYLVDKAAATDILSRIRDGIIFLTDAEQPVDAEVFIIYNAALGAFVDSHERILSAVCLYNNSFIQECMCLFELLAQDVSLMIDHRIEACMYLIYTEDERFRSIVIDVLTEIISDSILSNKYRYENVICKFNTETGLSTILNTTPLNVQYDEDLLHILQRTYFDNTDNDVRYRILSGQHLLQMVIVEEGEKTKIGERILEIAKDFQNNANFSPDEVVNIRADAADVVMRLGMDEQKEEAQTVIQGLGFFNTRRNLLTQRGVISYVGDAQNIHNSSIRKAIHNFILTVTEENNNLCKETGTKILDSYPTIHTELTTMIQLQTNLTETQVMKAFKALSRISIDTAVFTDQCLTSSEVMMHLWAKLKRIFTEEDDERCSEIKQRLVDELIDMADTCSSGHAGRVANVLAGFGYGVDINISFKEQVVANTGARMQKRIMDIEDEETKQSVICGMDKDAVQEDLNIFLTFISSNATSLREELYEEFVGEGWVEEKKFNMWFDEVINSWSQSQNRFVQEEES